MLQAAYGEIPMANVPTIGPHLQSTVVTEPPAVRVEANLGGDIPLSAMILLVVAEMGQPALQMEQQASTWVSVR